MPQRWLVTGSREWVDAKVVRDALSRAPPGSVVVHGGARGLDSIAAREAAALGLSVEAHPADWARFRKRAGRLRNQAMVDLGADVCLAFPLPGSIGTWDCVRRAEAAGIVVLVYSEAG